MLDNVLQVSVVCNVQAFSLKFIQVLTQNPAVKRCLYIKYICKP